MEASFPSSLSLEYKTEFDVAAEKLDEKIAESKQKAEEELQKQRHLVGHISSLDFA